MYKARVNDQVFELKFSDDSGLKGAVNGEVFEMDFSIQGSTSHLLYNNKSYKVDLVSFDKDKKTCVVKINNKEYLASVEDKYDILLNKLGLGDVNNKKVNQINAPMPGLVLTIRVKVGSKVSKGDGLLVLEAMKMENIIKSPTDGIVKSIEVNKSDTVEKNQVLIKFK
mgnify:CR=1 FL=1